MKRIFVLAVALLIPVMAWASIDSVDKRRACARYGPEPDGDISQDDRRQYAGYYVREIPVAPVSTGRITGTFNIHVAIRRGRAR